MNLIQQWEKYIEDYLDKKEEEAWSNNKHRLLAGTIRLPKAIKDEIEDIIKNTFLAGYTLGSIDGNEEIKNLAKNDPVLFYHWLSEK